MKLNDQLISLKNQDEDKCDGCFCRPDLKITIQILLWFKSKRSNRFYSSFSSSRKFEINKTLHLLKHDKLPT